MSHRLSFTQRTLLVLYHRLVVDLTKGSIARIGIFNPSTGFHQSLVERADVKFAAFFAAVAAGNDLLLSEVDSNINVSAALLERKQLIDLFFRQFDGQHPAVEHVLPEDARIALCDHSMNLVNLEDPWSVFARRTTTEVFTC